MKPRWLALASIALVISLAAVSASALDPSKTPFFDDLWSHAKLYENDANPVVQDLSLVGRAQGDVVVFDGDQGHHSKADWRRFRVGVKSSILQDAVFHAEVDFDLNSHDYDDTYGRLTDFYLGWSRDAAFKIKLGKQSAPFTLDGATSSKSLITLERSTLATNLWFPTEYFTGVVGLGKKGRWSYHAGAYSSSGDDEFGSFDSGYFGLASLGYDLSEATGLDEALVRIEYVYNDPDDSGDVGTRDLRHVGSLVGRLQTGRIGFWSNVALAKGIGSQSDLFGLQLMPYYDFTESWQVVFRYSLVTSSGDNGVRLNRYESRIESGRSDEAHEFFLGLNWFIYGHKFKWQNGIEYTHASDSARDGGRYNGWGFSSGIRISW
jgi:phosphate-selective porin OprO/OprP